MFEMLSENGIEFVAGVDCDGTYVFFIDPIQLWNSTIIDGKVYIEDRWFSWDHFAEDIKTAQYI